MDWSIPFNIQIVKCLKPGQMESQLKAADQFAKMKVQFNIESPVPKFAPDLLPAYTYIYAQHLFMTGTLWRDRCDSAAHWCSPYTLWAAGDGSHGFPHDGSSSSERTESFRLEILHGMLWLASRGSGLAWAPLCQRSAGSVV